MATATFTTVVARVDQTLTNAIWADQIKDNLNQLAGAHANLLTNGGFEVWQRGAGAFTADTAYTADRWYISGTTATVTQETTTVDSSGNALKLVKAAGGNASMVQKVEGHLNFRGKSVSVSVRLQQSVGSAVTLIINDNIGSTTATSSSTTGSYITLTATRAISASATVLEVSLQCTATGTFYFDNAMLVIGPAPAPYQPLHPADDLGRCQRYYEVVGGAGAGELYHRGVGAAGVQAGTTLHFKTTKSGTPTVTKNGTWNVANCGQPAVSGAGPGSCLIQSTVTGAGDFFFTTNTADDSVTVESNP
jgi:hypothetical protein